MHLAHLAAAVLVAYGANAQAPAAPPATAAGAKVASAGRSATAAPTGMKQPSLIPMNCTQAYLPFSEADVAALSSNDTKVATSGNYSTIPTEAACKGPAGTADGLCDIASCEKHPELTITGTDTVKTGTTIIPQVTCTNNYLFGNSSDPIKNVCTDGNDKTYTCTGGCTSFTSCNMCVSIDDPALQSVGP
ncbi:hypothetical protein VP01_3890g3 [Puccinia sorghi]|uniref:Uncharacterized protein n=1 Tax=Puccinia sorghi TaxID=27349 RepID=A0A0L6USS0_9BASI|nr:hypothetical protein VP01_3890g3 [Puccinia sorghi]